MPNTALRDANLLRRNLIAVRDGQMALLDAIGDYEGEMRDYGFDAVLKSREQMDGNGATRRPVVGRAVLAGLRTSMRIVNAVPPLKRRMNERMMQFRGVEREG